jgi:hypothetical protein
VRCCADAVEDALLPADASGACVISLASPATESVDSCSGGGRSGRLGTPPDFVLPTLKVRTTHSVLRYDFDQVIAFGSWRHIGIDMHHHRTPPAVFMFCIIGCRDL